MNAKIDYLEGGTKAIISQGAGWLPRLLGVPTLMVGLYIAYYIVVGFLEYLTNGATVMDWLESVPAFFFMAIFSLLFVTPSLYLMLAFDTRTELDRELNMVTQEVGKWPFRKVSSFPLARFSKLTRRSERSTQVSRDSTHRSTKTVYTTTVSLTGEGDDDVLLATFTSTEHKEAEDFRSELSSWLGW